MLGALTAPEETKMTTAQAQAKSRELLAELIRVGEATDGIEQQWAYDLVNRAAFAYHSHNDAHGID